MNSYTCERVARNYHLAVLLNDLHGLVWLYLIFLVFPNAPATLTRTHHPLVLQCFDKSFNLLFLSLTSTHLYTEQPNK